MEIWKDFIKVIFIHTVKTNALKNTFQVKSTLTCASNPAIQHVVSQAQPHALVILELIQSRAAQEVVKCVAET